MSNIYYSPEDYGLKQVGELSWYDEPYSFDLTVVWHNSAGDLYWASDSGCSCPSPFESFNMTNIESGNKYNLAAYLMNRVCEYDEYRQEELKNQVVELLSRL